MDRRPYATDRRWWRSKKSGGDFHLVIDKEKSESVGGDSNLMITGNHSEQIDGTVSSTVGKDLQIKCGANTAVEAKKFISKLV